VLLALDAKLEIRKSTEESQTSNIGEFLPLRPRGLITSITLPLNAKVAFDYVSRTPADKPIVCTAVAQWNSGRTRLAVGGYGRVPMLAMDGTESEGVQTAARNAFHEAADEYGSAEYRMDVAATLAKRCLESLA
jgi:CO/xanthine dehydrogenase FAD-binding subunit